MLPRSVTQRRSETERTCNSSMYHLQDINVQNGGHMAFTAFDRSLPGRQRVVLRGSLSVRLTEGRKLFIDKAYSELGC